MILHIRPYVSHGKYVHKNQEKTESFVAKLEVVAVFLNNNSTM